MQKLAWGIGVLLSLCATMAGAESIVGGKADRIAFDPTAAHLIFGCPTKDALDDVHNTGIHDAPGENVCSVFDGAYVVGRPMLYAVVETSFGFWNEQVGTYVSHLYMFRVGDHVLYGAWPFDLDDDLLIETVDAAGVKHSSIVGFGFQAGVDYEEWPPAPAVRMPEHEAPIMRRDERIVMVAEQ